MIALPDFPVFTNLIARTRHALEKLNIGVLLVRQTCTVDRFFSPRAGKPAFPSAILLVRLML
jgi:hypothetical protein